ncbi:hypothetical protein JY651_13530 [Pyxidicoccus parkwayensis]|uniref:Uncharacterized protein n=1 Tax=Pyxidicoccus parkwayensis TaxID=2813578 RepID=A0ABX7P5Y8_9BACT|nr:hypothetical protein [Pyxidicoccus parkwaysis]QSQ25881.1 hypothetical protein JY651_13530 [Pyxidicoccus parkwaysis]
MAIKPSVHRAVRQVVVYVSIFTTMAVVAIAAAQIRQASDFLFGIATVLATLSLLLVVSLSLDGASTNDPSKAQILASFVRRIANGYTGVLLCFLVCFIVCFGAIWAAHSVRVVWVMPPVGGHVVVSSFGERKVVQESGAVHVVLLGGDDKALERSTNCIPKDGDAKNGSISAAGLLRQEPNFPFPIVRCSSIPDGDVDRRLVVVGSGTVEGFINRINPALLDQSMSKKILVLQGASDTGIKVMAEAFDHGRDLNTRPVLAMSSVRYDDVSRFQTHNPGFYEVDLGPSRIYAYFVRDRHSAAPRTNLLGATIDGDWWSRKDCRIPVRELVDLITVPKGEGGCPGTVSAEYSVSLTSIDSGTRRSLAGSVPESEKTRCWISHRIFGLKLSDLDGGRPWIAVGSEVVDINSLPEMLVNRCEVLLDAQSEQRRHLFLYGRVDRAHVDAAGGYQLAKEVCEFLGELLPQARMYWDKYGAVDVAKLVEAQRVSFLRFEDGKCFVRNSKGVDIRSQIIRYVDDSGQQPVGTHVE